MAISSLSLSPVFFRNLSQIFDSHKLNKLAKLDLSNNKMGDKVACELLEVIIRKSSQLSL